MNSTCLLYAIITMEAHISSCPASLLLWPDLQDPAV